MRYLLLAATAALVLSGCAKGSDTSARLSSLEATVSTLQIRIEELEKAQAQAPNWILWEYAVRVHGEDAPPFVLYRGAISAFPSKTACFAQAEKLVPASAQQMTFDPLTVRYGKDSITFMCLPQGTAPQ